MFSGCVTSLNYWVLSILGILSVWGNIQGSLGGLELKIEEKKSRNPSDNPWGAAPTRDPMDGLCPSISGTPLQHERLRH